MLFRSNGNYTADMRTAADYDTILAHLNLTVRQAEVLRLRMQGRGFKAIATYLGVDVSNVKRTVKQIQKKAREIGLTPHMEG